MASGGLILGPSFTLGKLTPSPRQSPQGSHSTVYFRPGSSRRRMIYDALMPLEDTVKSALGSRQIIIKPNFVASGRPLCATHVDAVRGILDFLKRLTDQQILIAESPASGDAIRCFDEYGYNVLKKEYAVRLVDLNTEPFIEVGGILQSDGSLSSVRIIKTLLSRRNYLISVSLPKTHDTVVATLTTKNIIMASPLRPARPQRSDKVKMHGGQIVPQNSEYLSKNMFLLAGLLLPDLAVLDGFEGMEGNGPVRGSAVPHHVALAGTDSLAVDAVGAKLMGIEPRYLPYLKWCGDAGLGNFDLDRIKVSGPDPSPFIKKYKLHETFETQVKWITNTS